MSKNKCVSEDNMQRFLTLAKVAFYLYMIENFSLIGTAYIANVDNYREYTTTDGTLVVWKAIYAYYNMYKTRSSNMDIFIKQIVGIRLIWIW